MGTKDKVESCVGKEGTIQIGGLTVAVAIKDYKNSYGRDRFLVTPIAGKGEVWIETVIIKK